MQNDKERDLLFIKSFSNITLKDICDNFKIDKSNVYRGIASAKTIALVREEIMKRYDHILSEYNKNNIDGEKK